MNPTSLLNVSPDLMRARARAGSDAIVVPMAGASDRSWSLAVLITLALLSAVLAAVLV